MSEQTEEEQIAAARKRYPFIVKWGYYLRSYDYYIDNECLRAVEENAPENAISRSHDGKWDTIDDVKNPDARRALGLDT